MRPVSSNIASPAGDTGQARQHKLSNGSISGAVVQETLYHSEIFLPDWFTAPTKRVKVDYGHHAKREALVDRYGEIALPAFVNLRRFRVIEVGVRDGRVSKILFRGKLDANRDLCIVLIPNGDKPWRCKTVWTNVRSDLHRTLDASRYATA